MKRITKLLFFTMLLQAVPFCLYAQTGEHPDKRLALVMGNGNYQVGVLANPENDAKAMKLALEKLGFQVDEYENLTQRQMKEAIDDFGMKLKNYDIGLCFYAGHGVQSNGVNYLVPVDADLKTEVNVEYDCVQADRIISHMEASGAKVNILILDACRNNPFERSWSRSLGGGGLAQMLAPKGTLIEYATAPNHTASDGSGNNGLYTSAILNNIFSPDEDVTLVFRKVRAEVVARSNSDQVPWEASSLVGTFIFNPQNSAPPVEQTVTLQPVIKSAGIPVMATPEVTSISPFDAGIKVNVTDDGGAQVIARGICFSTSPEPGINSSKTLDGVGAGIFTTTINGLRPDKTYYVRAYAVNYMGTSYSPQINFKTTIAKPTVTTEPVSKIESFSAIGKATITDNGGYKVLSRGFCWNTSGNPTINDNKRIVAPAFGTIADSLTRLEPSTTYYLKAFTSDSSGYYYGNEVSFKTLLEDQITDVDGNIYSTKKFINQYWMTENLKTTRFNDGTPIGLVIDQISWKNNQESSFCWYDNLEAYKETYGALYNLKAVKSDKLCPAGWHVPSVEDWDALINIRGKALAGTYLKEIGFTHWEKSNNGNQDFNSLFAGLPGGDRLETGYYGDLGLYGYYWSSFDAVQSICWCYQLSFNLPTISRKKISSNAIGYSVRCVRNYSAGSR